MVEIHLGALEHLAGLLRQPWAAGRRILRRKQLAGETAKVVDRARLLHRGHAGAARLPVRGNAQNRLGPGQLLTHLAPHARDLVVLDRIHRAAMPDKDHRHGLGVLGRVDQLVKLLELHDRDFTHSSGGMPNAIMIARREGLLCHVCWAAFPRAWARGLNKRGARRWRMLGCAPPRLGARTKRYAVLFGHVRQCGPCLVRAPRRGGAQPNTRGTATRARLYAAQHTWHSNHRRSRAQLDARGKASARAK